MEVCRLFRFRHYPIDRFVGRRFIFRAVDHVRRVSSTRFAWEDMTFGGDRDFEIAPEGQPYYGGVVGFAPLPRSGIFAAVDVTTNELAWRYRWVDQCYSGSLATAGGLVFVGRNDGRMTALDSDTGRTLWEELVHRYYAGVDSVRAMQRTWAGLRGRIDDERFREVLTRQTRVADMLPAVSSAP